MTGWRRWTLHRPRLGVGISQHAVRGVLVSRGEIVRAATVAVTQSVTLVAALDALLTELAPRCRRRPAVFAAVGPSASQLRRVERLPALTNDRALHDAVRANAGRFFLKNGAPLLISSLRRQAPGDMWAAAFDEPVVRTLTEVCAAHRLRLDVCVPTMVALPLALRSDALSWSDGELHVVARYERDGAAVRIRSTSAGAANGPEKTGPALGPVPALAALGAEAPTYADAFGATLVARSEPLAICRRETRRWADARLPGWRLCAAGSALAIASLFAFMGPALAARSAARSSAKRLAALNTPLRTARWTENELSATTAALGALADFAAGRRSVTRLLAELTAALSESVSLTNLRLDADGGTLVAVAPRAASILSELADVHSIQSATLVGPVTPEVVGTEHLERATIRFHWRVAARAARPSLTTRGSTR